jgi:glycosyltransferase involved in cell wall biosynthesis
MRIIIDLTALLPEHTGIDNFLRQLVLALAGAMRRMLIDDEVRAERRAKGLERASQYRWDRTARDTVACYRSAVTGLS